MDRKWIEEGAKINFSFYSWNERVVLFCDLFILSLWLTFFLYYFDKYTVFHFIACCSVRPVIICNLILCLYSHSPHHFRLCILLLLLLLLAFKQNCKFCLLLMRSHKSKCILSFWKLDQIIVFIIMKTLMQLIQSARNLNHLYDLRWLSVW